MTMFFQFRPIPSLQIIFIALNGLASIHAKPVRYTSEMDSCQTGCPTEIRIALSVELESLDPQISSSIDAIKVQSALFEGLVVMDPFTGKVEASGASSWDTAPDGMELIFHLCEDALWSNGEPVTAQDYVYGFRRLLHPSLGSPYADQYVVIEGSDRYRQSLDPDALAVTAIDPHTLRIRLGKPTPHFIDLLARPCAAPLHAATVKGSGDGLSRNETWSTHPGFVTNGPYSLAHWRVNESIRLTPNPLHKRPGQALRPFLVFRPIESAHVQERAFQSGAIHVTSKIPSERIPVYMGQPTLETQVELATFYLILNTNRAGLDSQPLRQLMGNAIDRRTITDHIRMRGEQPTRSFVPPFHGFPSPPPPSDIENPSIPDSTRRLTLIFSSSETNQAIAEALQAQVLENTGIHINLQRVEWKSYLDRRNRKDFDICMATWIADYPDPLAFLEMWTSDAANNFAGWKNPAFDQLILSSANCSDPESRMQMLGDAHTLLIREQPVIPLFHLNRMFLILPSLRPWGQSLLNTIRYPTLSQATTVF
ncbi:MAG: Periplasmic oligopeptide-binding protein precursor [Verrucomicrobia bacterium ADurb.Bin474]|nr:MAG: Periplasmic oligopeptide-binding protein precursor [Verrucomicrobia bacterium ADurb.Bin474]